MTKQDPWTLPFSRLLIFRVSATMPMVGKNPRALIRAMQALAKTFI
jgi:hypothetical protein